MQACPQCLNMDIVILGDYSGSVHKSEQYVIDAFESFASITSEEKNIRVGLILFADEPEINIPLTKDLSTLLSASAPLREQNASGSTDINAAIEQAAILLYSQQNNSRKLIILISDGDITDGATPDQTIATARQLSILGVSICTVLIKNSSSHPEFMKEISSGCYVESSYENLSAELGKMDVCL